MDQNDARTIQDRVNDVCNAMIAKGEKPSVRLVQAQLQDVKSLSTVHKYFSAWQKELEANSQSLYDRLGFSSEFTQSFMKEITRFGVEAEQRYKEQASNASDQRDAALEDLERSEEKLHKQSAVVEQQHKAIAQLEQDIQLTRKQLEAEIAKEKKAYEATITELRNQLDSYSHANRVLTEQSESLRTEVAKAELRLEGNSELVSEVKGRSERQAGELDNLRAELGDLKAVNASQSATISGAEQLVSQLRSESAKLEKANQSLTKVAGKVEAERDALARQITELQATVAEQSKTADSYFTAIGKVEVERDALARQVSELQAAVTNSTKEK